MLYSFPERKNLLMKPFLFNQNQKELYDLPVTKEYAIKLLPTSEMTENDKISILSDVMFKTLFYNPNHLIYSAKFLSYFMDNSLEEILNNIRLGLPDPPKNNVMAKNEHCDYIATIDDSIINIEINCNSSLETLKRNMDYAYRLRSNKVKIGSKYTYSTIYQFNINNFAFTGNDKIIDIYKTQNNDNIVLTNDVTFIQIYIPNINKKCYTKDKKELSEFERFILSLVKTNKDESLKFIKGDEVMEKLVEDQYLYSRPDDLIESYDHELAMKDEGHREGLEEGIEQGKQEIINNMLELKMSKEEISKILKVSISELDNIINTKQD